MPTYRASSSSLLPILFIPLPCISLSSPMHYIYSTNDKQPMNSRFYFIIILFSSKTQLTWSECYAIFNIHYIYNGYWIIPLVMFQTSVCCTAVDVLPFVHYIIATITLLLYIWSLQTLFSKPNVLYLLCHMWAHCYHMDNNTVILVLSKCLPWQFA